MRQPNSPYLGECDICPCFSGILISRTIRETSLLPGGAIKTPTIPGARRSPHLCRRTSTVCVRRSTTEVTNALRESAWVTSMSEVCATKQIWSVSSH